MEDFLRAMDPRVAEGVHAVLAAAGALPSFSALEQELALVEAACARGYFLPDEEEAVHLRYMQYLSLRAALLDTLADVAAVAGEEDASWRGRIPAFVTAFSAACLLARASRFVTDLAVERPVLWKKLDEEHHTEGVPRKSFTRLYRASVDPRQMARFHAASAFYAAHRGEILELRPDPVFGPLVELLLEEEGWIARRRESVKRHFRYRWYSFLRRHRSAWKQVMGGLFEAAGCAVSELRQPGVKPRGAAKRVTPFFQQRLLELARPGDVFVTRHDDAVSNLFLPGFWPHAALHLGTASERAALGAASGPEDPLRFLEAKKDGVRFRQAAETLGVDACVVLRPPFGEGDLRTALLRSMGHEGKLYDFLFDFRRADRMVCTEVVYRGFHGIGPVAFRLKEVSNRLCLPAEDLLDQALECGFRVVATAGIGGRPLLAGDEAEGVFRASRKRS